MSNIIVNETPDDMRDYITSRCGERIDSRGLCPLDAPSTSPAIFYEFKGCVGDFLRLNNFTEFIKSGIRNNYFSDIWLYCAKTDNFRRDIGSAQCT